MLFSASIPYEALKRVYDSRASQTVRKRLSQTNLISLFSGVRANGPRMEYVRLVGSSTGNQGHAELAVSRTKASMNYLRFLHFKTSTIDTYLLRTHTPLAALVTTPG